MTGLEKIASVCHEANRAWCEANGDDSQVIWDVAPDWQRESALAGVDVALAGGGPEVLHNSWCEQKRRDGWVYGEVKDADATPPTHPCLVEYDALPDEQKAKDALFGAIVRALAGSVGA